MNDPQATIEIDMTADVAYITLSDKPVSRTVEVSEEVMVDLDEFGVVVGVEVLRLGAQIPFGKLTDQLHVHSEVIELLRRVQPSVSGMLELTQAAEGTSSVEVSNLVPGASSIDE